MWFGRADIAATGVRVTSTVQEGHVGPGILRDAADSDADLIVMSTHGRSGLSRLWLGSIADRCVRSSERPVLLIRSPEAEGGEPVPFPPRGITVPLDGSGLAEAALPIAAELGQLVGAGLELIRVVGHAPTAKFAILNPAGILNHRLLELQKSDAEAYLAEIAERLQRREIPTTTRVLIGVSPGRTILQPAQDLIVMSTRGLGGLERAVLGSVTDEVVRGSRGPVLVWPAGADYRRNQNLITQA